MIKKLMVKGCSFIQKHLRNYLPDRVYLPILYYLKIGKQLNLRNPKGYREKIQCIKLFDRNPRYTFLVDKVLVKDYVSQMIGAEHVIPTLAVWDSPDEVDFDSLPDQFVLKCNHNSHLGLCICKDKQSLDREKAIAELKRGFNDNYYRRSREWAYRDVPRKVFAEAFIADENEREEDGVLTDYKYFCFDGQAKMMYISQDIAKDPRTDFFDMDFQHLPLSMQDKNADVLPQKPKWFDEMRQAAEMLSQGIPFVRVDFYATDKTFYFGEMTFYPSSGMANLQPEEWDEIIGGWMKVPNERGKLC